jgi:adenylosuccinate synthase
MNVIGNGVVIDPVVFFEELKLVETLYAQARKNLLISKRAHMILPTHRLLDAAYEHSRGESKIGSTLKGISPAYTDKYSRNGIRVGDLLSPDFNKAYQTLSASHLKLVDMLGYSTADFRIDGMGFSEFEARWKEDALRIKELKLEDTERYLNMRIKEGASILAEGAQGTLLDVDFGSFPFVTSSHTICGGVCTGLGIAPKHIGQVYGIFKAYCTRVGSGPFPTELEDATGELLRKKGFEFGATTGRPRRCGWLDLVALNYAIEINGVDQLIMTKADVLDTFEEIRVCNAYSIEGKDYFYPPYEICSGKISPALSSVTGWMSPITEATDPADLPLKLNEYIQLIENKVGVPVRMVSVGPDRKQIVER